VTSQWPVRSEIPLSFLLLSRNVTKIAVLDVTLCRPEHGTNVSEEPAASVFWSPTVNREAEGLFLRKGDTYPMDLRF
jgi:hypothetical protein